MAIKKLNSLDGPGQLINLTDAAADVLLLPGEVAVLNYSAATSIPLRVLSPEGIYKITLCTTENGSPANNNDCYLDPNGQTYAGANMVSISIYKGPIAIGSGASTTAPGGYAVGNQTRFNLGGSVHVNSEFTVSTFTINKSLQGTSCFRQSGGLLSTTTIVYWGDNSTPWASLGTLVLPFAQSGQVVIKRIV